MREFSRCRYSDNNCTTEGLGIADSQKELGDANEERKGHRAF
jgi:hypothetical protein